jgi:hypothetical protein
MASLMDLLAQRTHLLSDNHTDLHSDPSHPVAQITFYCLPNHSDCLRSSHRAHQAHKTLGSELLVQLHDNLKQQLLETPVCGNLAG